MAGKHGMMIAMVVLETLLGAHCGPRGRDGRSGVYTSAIYESEAAMLRGESGSKHGCVWKGLAKKEGKVICRGNMQLRCGRKGWYKQGPC